MDTNKNKFEIDTAEGKWHGQEIRSDTTPMVDAGTGRPYILRTFEFGINPQVAKELKEKKIKLSKQDLFNYHWPQIQVLLYSDGLIENRDVSPKVIVGKKKYRIFVLCEPKFRQMVADRPNTLQEVFKK